MNRTGKAYGEALYDLARAESVTETLLAQLMVVHQSFMETPEFSRLLSTSGIPIQERIALLDRCFRERCHPYVLNLLKLLTEKGKIRHFSHCCTAFEALYNRDNAILPVTAVTAVALTPAQADTLTKKLSITTGRTIRLENRLDPSVLGGIRLEYEGRQLDGTLVHRLDEVRKRMETTQL